MGLRRHLPMLGLVLAAAWPAARVPPASAADAVLLYRCTAADGALTVQNAPCPAGTTQRIQRFTAPPPAAAPPVPAASPAPAPAAGAAASTNVDAGAATLLQPAPLPTLQPGTPFTSVSVDDSAGEILDSDVLRAQAEQQAAAEAVATTPLPDIYQCESRDGGRYLHEREPAPPHCVLMTVTGLGGATPVNAAGCEVIHDRCERIGDDQRCATWQQRFLDARGSERFAAPENRPAATAERERLQAVLAGSDCPVP